jgi:uncharacterized protein
MSKSRQPGDDARDAGVDPQVLTMAHVLPFGVFIGFLILLQLVTGLIGWDHSDAPWWRRDPAHWVYPLQSLACLGLLVYFRRQYVFDWSLRWSLVAVVFGAVGIGFWLLPTWLYDRLGLSGESEGWLGFFGVQDRRDGFDPWIFEDPAARAVTVFFRFLRAVVVVALVEEIFWRGFLMRFVQNWEGDWWKQPFGRHSWRAFLVVTFGFVAAHGADDRVGAMVYGSLTYLLCVWSKNLGACVVMHAVANLLMCVFIMQTGNLGLW